MKAHYAECQCKRYFRPMDVSSSSLEVKCQNCLSLTMRILLMTFGSHEFLPTL